MVWTNSGYCKSSRSTCLPRLESRLCTFQRSLEAAATSPNVQTEEAAHLLNCVAATHRGWHLRHAWVPHSWGAHTFQQTDENQTSATLSAGTSATTCHDILGNCLAASTVGRRAGPDSARNSSAQPARKCPCTHTHTPKADMEYARESFQTVYKTCRLHKTLIHVYTHIYIYKLHGSTWFGPTQDTANPPAARACPVSRAGCAPSNAAWKLQRRHPTCKQKRLHTS